MVISLGKKKIFDLIKSRYLALFGMLIILLFQPWRNNAMMSLGTWIIFFSTLFNLFQVISEKFAKNSSLILLFILALSVFSIVVSMDFTYSSLVALFCFCEIPIFWETSIYPAKDNFKKHIYITYLILSVYYVFLSFSSVSHKYIGPYGETRHDALTLGYNNPNQTGMYLLVCFFVLLSATAFFNKIIVKRIFLISAILQMFLVWKTESRACIIIAIVYLVYYCFFSKRSRIFLSDSFVRVIVFIPIIIFLLITLFHNTFEGLTVLDERFDTGRFTIYVNVLRNYNILNFFFGDFSKYAFSNLHNAYLSVMATIGFPAMVLFILFLYTKVTGTLKEVTQRYQRLTYVGLLALVIHMAFEAAFFTAGSVYAVSVLTLIWLSSNTQEG